uniref:Uncharacterized protein n=1 Tax=Glossina pallidipes TaxID=7398 RepID=A0A1A9ZZ89_GLOPL
MKAVLKQRIKETPAGMGHQSDLSVPTLESVYGRLEKCKRELKTIKTFHNATIKIEQEKMHRNKEDLFELRKRYKAMVLEEIEMKRKRWCPCGKEALERHLQISGKVCVTNGTGDDISVLRSVTTVGLANIPYMIPNISKSFSGSTRMVGFSLICAIIKIKLL